MTTLPRNFEALNWDQLRKYERLIQEAQAQKYQALKAEMAAMANDFAAKATTFATKHGLKAEDRPIVTMPASNGNGAHKAPAKRARKAKHAIPVKYRNPNKPEETWSGRGRPARWLAALEKSGKRREDFVVR